MGLAGVLLISSVSFVATELPANGADFGDYELVPLLGDAEPYAGPATPTSLADVRISMHLDDQLTPAARERLVEHGFVIVPSESRLFHAAYRELYGTGTPVFVTTRTVVSVTPPCLPATNSAR